MVFLCAVITFYSHTPYNDAFLFTEMSVGAFRGAPWGIDGIIR